MGSLRVKLCVLTVFICVLLLTIDLVEARKRNGRRKNQNNLISRPEWKTRRNKNSECRLGGKRFAINATWSPDLGPPFGVWSCVTCTCKPVRRKRRIVAKVICTNVKKQCPKTPCDNPILAPGACCKLCPGQQVGQINDYRMQRQEASPETDLTGREFAVLLNGRTSEDPITTNHLATGRVFLRRGTLHFSFVLDRGTPSPSVIQFLSADNSILEEIEAQPTPYEVNNGRICGTWTRVPHEYRTLLKRGEMWVALVPSNELDAISGQIKRYKGVNTEVFSSLLSPVLNNQVMPGGGTAIVSVSALSDSLHVSLIFNGIFKKSTYRNITLIAELTPVRSLESVRETMYLDKVFSDINEVDFLTTLGETSLRLLTRGKVTMKVWSADSPELAIEGPIIARATCNVYSTVLTTIPTSVPQIYGAGWALLFVSNDGDFEYQVKLEGLPSPVVSIVFETTGKRKVREVEDITTNYKDGWVNGSYGRPTYRDLDMLLRKRLDISVILENKQALMGTFESVSVTEALRTMYPTLLRSSSYWMAATAWVAVDAACVMHYDVYLAGTHKGDPTWQLILREQDTTWDPRLEQNNITLEHIVTGRDIAAHNTLLTKISLTRLLHGVASLELTISENQMFHPSRMLNGTLSNVKVPEHCLITDGTTDNKIDPWNQNSPACKGMICMLDERADDSQIHSKKCIDDQKIVYEDGETWRSPISKCHRCMCTLGKMHCQPEPCPQPKCADPVMLPGHCCPSCPISSAQASERVCVMDKDSHSIGSYWHPFLAPKGFNLCVTCHCNVTADLKPRIECEWVTCPKLQCIDSESEMVEGSCCRKCKKVTRPRYSPIRGMISDLHSVQYDQETTEQILANGGCLERGNTVRRNGESFFPNVSRKFGKMCIHCYCKDGRLDCSHRKKCKKMGKMVKRKDFIQKKRKSRRKLNRN